MSSPVAILAGFPNVLRDELLSTYKEISSNYLEHRWEPSELNGGKFCEIAYSIINGALSGTFPPRATKPSNMLSSCQALEQTPANSNRIGDRSLRILIPRVLPILYEIRNNRNVGHVGGDVDPNFLDATAVHTMSSWVLAEFVRIFHNIGINDAQAIVDALIERKNPLIWEVEGKRRVLDTKLKMREQVLVLLHGRPSSTSVTEMVSWVEYSNTSKFRNELLASLHADRLIEFDRGRDTIRISPNGVKEVEAKILKIRTPLQ